MSDHIKIYHSVLDAAFCKEAIQRFDKDPRTKPDPQPDYSQREYLRLSDYPEWNKINDHLGHTMVKVTQKYFAPIPGLEDVAIPEWSDDGYVMSRYNKGDICAMHVDGQCPQPPINGLRIATLLFFLNTVDHGGETWFPMQKKKIKPTLGSAVMFPVSYTHPHSVLATLQKRYIIQTWIIDPQLVVNFRS